MTKTPERTALEQKTIAVLLTKGAIAELDALTEAFTKLPQALEALGHKPDQELLDAVRGVMLERRALWQEHLATLKASGP